GECVWICAFLAFLHLFLVLRSFKLFFSTSDVRLGIQTVYSSPHEIISFRLKGASCRSCLHSSTLRVTRFEVELLDELPNRRDRYVAVSWLW
ncbi:hypothetical protein CSUI_008441, partial [Cystoisospora suis]